MFEILVFAVGSSVCQTKWLPISENVQITNFYYFLLDFETKKRWMNWFGYQKRLYGTAEGCC